jgi:hypothetical protein
MLQQWLQLQLVCQLQQLLYLCCHLLLEGLPLLCTGYYWSTFYVDTKLADVCLAHQKLNLTAPAEVVARPIRLQHQRLRSLLAWWSPWSLLAWWSPPCMLPGMLH